MQASGISKCGTTASAARYGGTFIDGHHASLWSGHHERMLELHGEAPRRRD